jgi:hypothetical protein
LLHFRGGESPVCRLPDIPGKPEVRRHKTQPQAGSEDSACGFFMSESSESANLSDFTGFTFD